MSKKSSSWIANHNIFGHIASMRRGLLLAMFRVLCVCLSVELSVCLSVCLSVGHSHELYQNGRTDRMPSGHELGEGGSRNHVLGGGPNPFWGKGNLWGNRSWLAGGVSQSYLTPLSPVLVGGSSNAVFRCP